MGLIPPLPPPRNTKELIEQIRYYEREIRQLFWVRIILLGFTGLAIMIIGAMKAIW